MKNLRIRKRSLLHMIILTSVIEGVLSNYLDGSFKSCIDEFVLLIKKDANAHG